MASLKEIRTRISSVISTRQITNAMKMVSAAKLRKAQEAIIRMRPYADKLHHILTHLSDSLIMDQDENNLFVKEREINRILIVVITSNRGLCGAFNSNIIRTALKLAFEEYNMYIEQNKLDFYLIGRRGRDYLRRKGYSIVETRTDLLDGLNFEKSTPVAEKLMDMFLKKEYDKIFLVYNQFKNAAVQILTTEQFLPVQVPASEDNTSAFVDYIFEPSKEYIVRELIPKSLKIQFYKALIDSNAAEHGARMTAMHKATDNATELLRDLRLHYNKARQATITKELLEIVTGAEALKG